MTGVRRRIMVAASVLLLLLLLLLVVVAAGVLGWWLLSDPYRILPRLMDQVALPDGLELVYEEERGNRACFFECPSVVRHYLTDNGAEEICEQLGRTSEGWPGEPQFQPRPDREGCSGGTRVQRRRGVSVAVRPLPTDQEILPGTVIEIPARYEGATLVRVTGSQAPQ